MAEASELDGGSIVSALVCYLSRYAAYHQNGRNVATHVIGIPMIVLAVEILLSRPHWAVGPIGLSLAVPAAAAAVFFYLSLDLALGVAMAVLLGIGAWVGSYVAASATSLWLSAGIGALVIGWVIQFLGHVFEGRKPAFLDDINGLIIGPLFIVAEVAFLLGFRKGLKEQIDETRAT